MAKQLGGFYNIFDSPLPQARLARLGGVASASGEAADYFATLYGEAQQQARQNNETALVRESAGTNSLRMAPVVGSYVGQDSTPWVTELMGHVRSTLVQSPEVGMPQGQLIFVPSPGAYMVSIVQRLSWGIGQAARPTLRNMELRCACPVLCSTESVSITAPALEPAARIIDEELDQMMFIGVPMVVTLWRSVAGAAGRTAHNFVVARPAGGGIMVGRMAYLNTTRPYRIPFISHEHPSVSYLVHYYAQGRESRCLAVDTDPFGRASMTCPRQEAEGVQVRGTLAEDYKVPVRTPRMPPKRRDLSALFTIMDTNTITKEYMDDMP